MTHRATAFGRSALAATAAASAIALLGSGGTAEARTDAPPQGMTQGLAQGTPQGMTQASLLRFDQIAAAGLAVDDGVIGTRGDQLLGDAGRFDEGCLGEKTMRNITNAKAYPAPGTATPYFDATWISTRDKDVWLRESIAVGTTAARTSRYVRTLLDEIGYVTSCQQDPAQAHRYGPAHHVTVGTATGTYFVDHESDGSSDGGGVAVIRDGHRFGYVDLLAGPGKPGAALRQLTVAAARDLR